MADDVVTDPPRFPRPPERIDLPHGRALVRVRAARTLGAVRAINESLDHLRPWMAWAAEPANEATLGTFFAASEVLWDEGRDFSFSIVEGEGADERIVGGAGLHGRLGPRGLEIGYWVHVDRIGQGIATDVAGALTGAAFAGDAIDRVRIQCEDTNARSARVPEKLGYTRIDVTVPDDGPCAGRPTQIWIIERADWIASGGAAAS
jgi:RimJ/RimL family protein N-acetyltransferase